MNLSVRQYEAFTSAMLSHINVSTAKTAQ